MGQLGGAGHLALAAPSTVTAVITSLASDIVPLLVRCELGLATPAHDVLHFHTPISTVCRGGVRVTAIYSDISARAGLRSTMETSAAPRTFSSWTSRTPGRKRCWAMRVGTKADTMTTVTKIVYRVRLISGWLYPQIAEMVRKVTPVGMRSAA
jgi:hypothetical protein